MTAGSPGHGQHRRRGIRFDRWNHARRDVKRMKEDDKGAWTADIRAMFMLAGQARRPNTLWSVV